MPKQPLGAAAPNVTPVTVKRKGQKNKAQLWHQLAIEHLGGKCGNCSGRDDLFIHHKDGDDSNNAENNLQVLCRKCHAALHGKIRFNQKYPVHPFKEKLETADKWDTWIVDYDLPQGNGRRAFYRAVQGWLREHVTGETTGWSTQSVVITEDQEFAEFVYAEAQKQGVANMYHGEKVK